MKLHEQWAAQLLDDLEDRNPNLSRALATPPLPCIIKAAFAALQAFALELAACIAENTQPDAYDPQPDKRCEGPN